MSSREIKSVRVNATADGDNTIVAGTANRRLRVIAFVLVGSAAGTVTLQDDAASPTIFATFPVAANGGVSFAGTEDGYAFQTAQGAGLEVSNTAGLDTTGFITYCLV